MKTTIDGFDDAAIDPPTPARREWTAGSIGKIALGVALLSLVYLVSSWLPVENPANGGELARNFLAFWLCGGIFTVLLLAITDRRS